MSYMDDEEMMAFFEDPPGNETEAPLHPALRTSVKVKETVCPQTFIEENKEWLEKLLQPEARIEAMPHVVRNITRETIRVLPHRYNEALFKLFRDVGDTERSGWCLEQQVNMVVVARDHPIPQRPDKRFFAALIDRVWMIGHCLSRAGNPHGRELERVSWDLRAFMAFFVRQQLITHARRQQAQAQARAQAQHARNVQAQQGRARQGRMQAQAQGNVQIAQARGQQVQARAQARHAQAQSQAYMQARAQAQAQAQAQVQVQTQQAQGQGQTQPPAQGPSV